MLKPAQIKTRASAIGPVRRFRNHRRKLFGHGAMSSMWSFWQNDDGQPVIAERLDGADELIEVDRFHNVRTATKLIHLRVSCSSSEVKSSAALPLTCQDTRRKPVTLNHRPSAEYGLQNIRFFRVSCDSLRQTSYFTISTWLPTASTTPPCFPWRRPSPPSTAGSG